MPKLYYENDGWEVPGKQSRRALRVDIPSAPLDLAIWLNDRNVPAFPVFYAETVADPEPVVETTTQPERDDYDGGYNNYESPFGARSCLAGMDAVALVNAIKQMDGTNLGIILKAGCERLATLNRGGAL